MYNHAHILKEAAGSAFAPAIGGAGLGALASHALGGPAWLGALLGGGAGYLGADHINDALGLRQSYQGPPIGPAAKAPGAVAPATRMVGAGETMTIPPKDPLAISRSPDSMLPYSPPRVPISPNASSPGSLRPPAPPSAPMPSPVNASALSGTGGGEVPGGTLSAAGSLGEPSTPGSLRPPVSPGALASLSAGPSGGADSDAQTLNSLYESIVPAQPNPLGLNPRFLQYLALAQEVGGMSPVQAHEQLLNKRPDMRGISPLERLGLDQGHDERMLREKYEKRRKQISGK